MEPEYGIFIGRFQPFHIGHQAVINEILLDGLTPVIVIGSCNEDRDMNKNPLTFLQRMHLIQLIYPNVEIIFIKSNDYDDWDKWYSFLYRRIRDRINFTFSDQSVFYYNEKEVDKTTFEFNGKIYTDTWYTDIFKGKGFNTKRIALADRTDIKLTSNARDIRHNFEEFKHLLDARVYKQLKTWGWK